jgi:phytoene desaturase
MAKAGWAVTVLEKHPVPGGRARQLIADGFVFDMGPSWYWMPDVFERFFEQFGKK